jgi:hypothetical protein
MVEAKRSAPITPLLAEPAQRSTISAVAERSVRDTALGGANTAGSRGGCSLGDAGEAERSVGGEREKL